MNRRQVIRSIALLVCAATIASPVSADVLSKAAIRSLQKQALRQSGRSIGTRVLTQAEWQALQRELRNLDVATLRRIEARYGQFIPPERLAAAQECAVCYLDTPQMDAYLRQRRPDLTPTERAQILGLYDRERGAIVAASDRQMVLLPSTITHERLHYLSDPRYTEVMGLRLTEGTTEMLAQRIRRDMPLAGQPSIYPNETALLERLAARIGEARVSRAYFRGEMNQLAAELDRQLGKGAFNAVVHHARNGNWTAANRVLERGLR